MTSKCAAEEPVIGTLREKTYMEARVLSRGVRVRLFMVRHPSREIFDKAGANAIVYWHVQAGTSAFDQNSRLPLTTS